VKKTTKPVKQESSSDESSDESSDDEDAKPADPVANNGLKKGKPASSDSESDSDDEMDEDEVRISFLFGYVSLM
jgi:nucleolin